MTKLLLFLLIVWVAYLLWRGRQKPAAPPPGTNQPVSPEAMVSCTYCGLHIPLSESLEAAGRHYCSEEHRRLDRAAGGN